MHKAVRSTVFAVVSFLCLLSAAPLTAQFKPALGNHPRVLDTGSGSISLTTLGAAVTENFDTLSNTAGSTTNTALPAGWYITEQGGGARDNEQYGVDTGGSTTGDIYSYGAAASTDRALGALRSGTLIPFYGAKYTNNTGATITSLVVAYTGEEWRLGTAARTDQINFEYSLTATDLTTGTYTGVAALNFVTPDTATTGAKNGNAAADRTVIGPVTIPVSIANGATFFIRWTDTDATGADDGLSVDDFSLTANGVPPNNPPTITPPSNPAATVAQNAAPFPINLTGSDDNSIYNWSATPGTGVSSATVTGGQGSANVTYTVTLTAGYSGTATFTASLTDNVNSPANQAVNITVIAPPAAPTGLAATAGTGHVALTWNSVGGATSYNVKRSTSAGTETTIASPATNSYDDATAVNGTPYFYVVSAVGAGGEGANSSEVTATPLAAPTGLTATPGNAHVVLNWTAVAGATGYNVKRSTSTGAETTLAAPATNSYDDLTAANGTQYFYVVTATNANGESVPSAEVNAMPAAPGILVISQAYGGAGCGTAGCSTYKNDYIELFNHGGSPVSVNGWSVQYAAATGTAWQVTALPNVSIQPGQYLLVAESAGANGVNNLPTPDATGTIAMSATAAKVALVNSTTALSGACPASATIIDLVGYGATANCNEGGANAPAPSTTTADVRANGGCTDAGNNSTDFAAAAPTPRNTASPTHSCSNNPPAITPPANPIATVTQNAAPFPVSLTGSDDGGVYNWSATPGTGVSTVTVTNGQGSNTVTYTVTVTAGFTGTATFTASLTDNVNSPATQAVNITVNPPLPPPAPTGLTATAGNAHVQLGWNAVGGAASYNVKRGTAPGGPYSTINSPGTNSYDDTTAVNGTTYYYVVSAVGAGGEGANSSEASATPQAAPAAPTGLTATPGDSHVALSWTASPGAATYTVKRGTAPGGPYGTTFPGLVTTSYDDTSAVNGTTYYYVVTATNGFGTSGNSNEASATPMSLVAPTGVAAQVGDSTVIINWNAVVGAATYNVKRSATPGGPYTTVGSPSVTTFSDNTAVNGTTYYYVVAGFSGSEGPISSEVTATPNTPSVLGVVISQVYGGGGNAGATLKNDFVELFNRGSQTVSLNGWFVHYSSATVTVWNSPVTAGTTPTALSGSIAPGHYYLVQEAAGANGAAANLPAPDATGTIALSATAAKIALTNTATIAVQCPSGGSVADFVGYGPTANCSETSPTPVLTNTTAAVRNGNGCNDTNNNASDFTVVTQPLNPRNSGTVPNNCSIINNPPSITPPANPIASVAQDAAPFTVNLSGSDDGGVYVWSATTGTGISNVAVSNGQSTATVTYTVTLVAGFNGTATFTATLSDGINPAVNQTVHIQVTAAGGNNPPVITPPANPITTVAQDPPPFTVNVSGTDDGGIFNWSATPGTGVASVNVTGGQGTATVTYTVALNAGFNGTATFTASLSDNVNPLVNQAVNITVLSAGATPNHVVISQLYGGGGNSGATFTNDFIELYNPTASPVNLGGWSVQYSPATNTGAFTGLQPIGGTIGPGEYYLISLASGGAVGSPLPTANVVNNSGFNMSGTTGKVALVNTGTPIPGPCTATAADTDIVDLVGYGSANCNEGGTNAPTPSNTTADFRKAGGNTDTNVNGNDFITGTPNPRRTTPIQEFGPAVVNTDPTTNGINAPRDASMIVTFTELVDVDPGWFNINCSSSGVHNDATVVEGAPDTWVITPNANFSPAEQCSVTIFKDSVHDRDTDDSVPGTDTLSADYTWTFTVATGTAPPYPSDVHLTMGNPSNATPSLSNPNNYLMQKPEMAISYSRDLGRPNWVSWHLTDEWVGSLARLDTFRPDPEVPPTWYRVLASDFFASGFDRGHMTPNADRDKETSIPINQATFLMSNMVAQAPGNNQGPWAALESYLRTLLPADELYIVSGPAGTGGTGSNGGVTNTVANGHVTVPASTWKCALVLPKLSGDDIARVTASTRTICVIMPNLDSIRNDDWHIYLKSVDQVEALSGYDLFSNVPAAIQNAIEGGVDGANPPGTANQSTSTNEDVQKAITLDAVSPAGALTYTILTGPFHGGLTGTGANRTYTPAPDFNGSDTFTWRVNDGTNNSNTSTFTINVAEVNDPPVASDDSKTATANNALTFASSDLTSNDSPGPANEAGQALTVTNVTSTASTHGTVTLNSGQVTYTPATGYAGPASFTYTVCDNGTTAGSLDALCTTGTVNVAVNPQVTTHFSVTAPANTTSGTPFNVTVTALDASNVTVTSYTGTVHFTSSSAGTLPADYAFVAGDNGAHSFSVTLTSTGAQSISTTDGGITGSANTTVAPPPATHFSVTAPANVTSGAAFNVTVTALDASNATVPGYTGTVHFTSSSAGSLPADYTFVGGDSGSHTFSVTLTSTGAQSITATDGPIAGTANTTVAPPPATHFSVTAPANVTSGAAFNVTVTALDASNVIVPSYTGTVHFTSSSAGSLPADYTFVGGDSGTHTFSVTLTSTGAQSITATDGGITGSANTTVAPPPATHFSVTAPANVTSGAAFNVTVTALDASNVIVPSYTGTVHFTSSSAGSLPSDYTFVGGDSGSHSFSVTLTSTGAQSITATDGGITGSANTTVAPPPATHFSVSAPANVTNGVAFNVTVTALDASNGIVPTYTGTVHFTSSSAGTLPADYTFVGGDNGAHNFTVTLTSNGSQSITVTDGPITGTANTTVTPPPATHFSVTAPASVTTGTSFSVTVTALAASNANATGYTGTVHFTSSSAGMLPADYTFVGGDNGSHTFSVTLDSPGSQTITATDTVTASITGTASTIVVCPPAPAPTANATNSGPACAGSTVNLFASGNGSVFSWTGPGGFTSSQQNPTGITVAGTYTVTVSTPGPCGGSAQASTTVVFNPIPSAAITTPSTVCATTAGYSASVPNAGAGATYTWSITNGNITGGEGTRSISYTSGSSGSVHLAVTVTSNAGCSASSSADPAIAPRPTITLPPSINVACGTSSVNIPFTLTGTGPWTIHWSDSVTQIVTSASSSRTLTVSGSMVLSATVDDASCTSSSASVSINVSTAPVITTQPVGQIVEPSEKATFTVVASGANLHYQWFVKHANGATKPIGTDSPSYSTTPEGNGMWFVTVSNACGSVTSDSVTAVTVSPRHHAAN
jgi:DNA/RNA endonuclease G (NUC1)/fibronectin type 3 domain-containing protein